MKKFCEPMLDAMAEMAASPIKAAMNISQKIIAQEKQRVQQKLNAEYEMEMNRREFKYLLERQKKGWMMNIDTFSIDKKNTQKSVRIKN